MKCEMCKKNDASVSISRTADGVTREMSVCEECARRSGLGVQLPIPMLTDFLFGIGVSTAAQASDRVASCPVCHMRTADFRKNSTLGCERCYETFAPELAPILESMHGRTRHVGKTPDSERLTMEIADVESALAEAVQAEDFEKAAGLRDRLTDLQTRCSVPDESPKGEVKEA